jgi:hypothetical protein
LKRGCEFDSRHRGSYESARMTKRAVICLAALLAGCGAEAQERPRPVPISDERPEVGPVPAGSAKDCVCGNEPGCKPCPAAPAASTASPAATGAPPKPAVFPPPAVKPPVERTKAPGDGEWKPVGVYKASGADSPVYRTVIHPHKIRPFVVVEIVAVDLSRLQMELVAGTQEPEGTSVPVDKRTGLVPAADQPSLVAVTNGGFKKRHGGHGIGIGADVMHAPTPEFCTFAKTRAGGYRVGTWSSMSGDQKDLAWFRQTPPCLVEGGAKHPDLAHEHKAKKWAGAEDGNKEIRRSAVGVGADPGILYFAIADYATAEWLTDGLVAAGITAAAELDINYSYTRFIVYEHESGGELRATSPLLKDLKAPRKEYWKEPSERDFFYLRYR